MPDQAVAVGRRSRRPLQPRPHRLCAGSGPDEGKLVTGDGPGLVAFLRCVRGARNRLDRFRYQLLLDAPEVEPAAGGFAGMLTGIAFRTLSWRPAGRVPGGEVRGSESAPPSGVTQVALEKFCTVIVDEAKTVISLRRDDPSSHPSPRRPA